MSDAKTVELVIALAIVVVSFMYIYDALTSRVMIDVLLAVLVFGAGLVYLFNNIGRK